MSNFFQTLLNQSSVSVNPPNLSFAVQNPSSQVVHEEETGRVTIVVDEISDQNTNVEGGVFVIAPSPSQNVVDNEVEGEEGRLEPSSRVENPLPLTIFGPAPGGIIESPRDVGGTHRNNDDPAQATRIHAGLMAPGGRPRGV